MLKAKKKISKKELKEDQFVLLTMQVQDFLQKYVKEIAMGVAGVIAVIFLGYWMISSSAASENTASTLLSRAQQQLASGDKDNGVAQMDAILNEYSGSAAAEKACFYLAEQHLADGNLEQAQTYLTRYISDFSGSNVMTQAAYANLANVLMQQKDFAGAATNFEKAANMDMDFPRSTAYVYAAAVAWKDAGNNDKAATLAQSLVDGYKDTHNDFQLKERADVLLNAVQ
ncbi:MAG: tetratricopeptide repeat protein [Calditrichota bacterium]